MQDDQTEAKGVMFHFANYGADGLMGAQEVGSPDNLATRRVKIAGILRRLYSVLLKTERI